MSETTRDGFSLRRLVRLGLFPDFVVHLLTIRQVAGVALLAEGRIPRRPAFLIGVRAIGVCAMHTAIIRAAEGVAIFNIVGNLGWPQSRVWGPFVGVQHGFNRFRLVVDDVLSNVPRDSPQRRRFWRAPVTPRKQPRIAGGTARFARIRFVSGQGILPLDGGYDIFDFGSKPVLSAGVWHSIAMLQVRRFDSVIGLPLHHHGVQAGHRHQF